MDGGVQELYFSINHHKGKLATFTYPAGGLTREAPSGANQSADLPHRGESAVQGVAQHTHRMRGTARLARKIYFLHADVRAAA